MTDEQALTRFAGIQVRYTDDARVSSGTGFGPSAGLRVDGRIFAMLVHGGLAVKLPRDLVAELIESGQGRPFGMGQKRPMREWVALPPEASADWSGSVAEAFAFVGDRS